MEAFDPRVYTVMTHPEAQAVSSADLIARLPALPPLLSTPEQTESMSIVQATLPPGPSANSPSLPVEHECTPSSTAKRPATPSSAGKEKKKAKKTGKSPSAKCFVWTNDMMLKLLEIRFRDHVIKKRIESADTSNKKRLAWQYFANRLSEELNVVLTGTQVGAKYKKLKHEYRQGKAARNETGNNGREGVSELWGILNTAFAGRTGIAGAVLADIDGRAELADDETAFNSSSVEEDEERSLTPQRKDRIKAGAHRKLTMQMSDFAMNLSAMDLGILLSILASLNESMKEDNKVKSTTPLENFADAMKEGMTAIASSMGADDKLATALQDLKASQAVTQERQAKQNTLLDLLRNKLG